MKIQPEAHNAITVILEDGSTIRLHDSVYGDKSYLFVNNADGEGGIAAETQTPNDSKWTQAAISSMLRISTTEGIKQ